MKFCKARFFLLLFVFAGTSFASEGAGFSLRSYYSFPAGDLSSYLESAPGFELGVYYKDLLVENFNLELDLGFATYQNKAGAGSIKETNLAVLGRYGLELSKGVDCIYGRAGSGFSLLNNIRLYQAGLGYERKIADNLHFNAGADLMKASSRSISGVTGTKTGSYLNISLGLSYELSFAAPILPINNSTFIENDARIKELILAFDRDNFNVSPSPGTGVFEINNKRGLTAVHKTAVIGQTADKKKAYYIEGTPYEQGYLMGLMSEPEVSSMCVDFNRDVVFEFVSAEITDPVLKNTLAGIIKEISMLTVLSTGMPLDIPFEYKEEIDGLYDGCKRVNPGTKVTKKDLWLLNVGIDALLSVLYSGKLPSELPKFLDYQKYMKPENFRIPLFCNGWTVKGDKVEGSGSYFGRDFMFPTANVFQKVACHVIRKPENGGLPTVSVAAPGMLGSVAGLNTKSVGIGIDMSPSGNCNPTRPGFNSLLLNRHAITYGNTCENAVKVIEDAQRGVSWDYVVADPAKSCIVEAGMKTDNLDFLSYVQKDIKEAGFIPSQQFIDQNLSAPVRKGMMVRWNDYLYPQKYLDLNKPLMDFMKEYKKRLVPLALILDKYNYVYDPADFSLKGFLNKTRLESNCPMSYYFAPQKEDRDDFLVASNHYVIPEMRLCAMNEWTQFIASGNIQDIQWRYDELNFELLTALESAPVTKAKLKEILLFCSPYDPGKFKDYYNHKGLPKEEVYVNGSISLMDLKGNVMDTLYGYFSDEWVTIHLNEYFR